MHLPNSALALVLCTALASAGCSQHPGSSDAGPSQAPGAPLLTATTTPAPPAVNLRWTPADALASVFEINRFDGTGGFTTIALATAPVTSFSDTSAGAGTPHAYRVVARNAVGESAASNEVDVLASPAGLRAAGSDTRVLLTWSAVFGAAGYDVYRIVSAAPRLLASVSGSSFLDDGGTVSLGPLASYAVVAKAQGGVVDSIGSLANAVPRGIDVTANATFISDTSEETRSLAGAVAFEARNIDGGPLTDDAGAPIFFESVSDGTVTLVPGVPLGTYAITVQGHHDYAVTAARAVDFSQAVMGRATARPVSDGTTLSYALSALFPWSAADAGAADAVQSISQGAGDFVRDLSQDIAAPPAAGATTFAGQEIAGFDGDPNLVEPDAGDAYYLYQLHAQTSSNGFAALSPVAGLAGHALAQVDGADTAVGGALQPLAQNTVELEFPLGAFQVAYVELHPLAQNLRHTLLLEEEKGFLAHGWYGQSADALVVEISSDAGTLEADGGLVAQAGSLAWANPAAPSWDAFARVETTYDVPVEISFIDASGTTPKTVSGSTSYESRSFLTSPFGGAFASPGPLPSLSPPRAPLLAGSSLFAAQQNVSRTSRLSWSAPASGTASYYLVIVHAVVPEKDDTGAYILDAHGGYVLDILEAASFTTKGTSVSLAADLLPLGYSYFATIDAIANAGASGPIDGTLSPYLLGPVYASAEAVTAVFTVAP